MEKVEYYFREISRIPRGSYNEKAICDYVENFAKERNIKYVRDKMIVIMIFQKILLNLLKKMVFYMPIKQH